MQNRSLRSRRLQTWLPGAVLALTALSILLAIGLLDSARSQKYGSLARLLLPDASGASWTMSLVGTSEGVAIAIVIVVVVLGVQLTADRYSPRIIDIFVRDPVNGAVLALFLGSIVFTIGVSAEIKADYVPEVAVLVAIGLAIINFSILLPYVRHMFDIMRAESIIVSIRLRALSAVGRAGSPRAQLSHRHEVRDALAQITDIALGSIQEGDTEVCLSAIEALRALIVEDYVPVKSRLQPWWFSVDEVDMPGASDQTIAQVDRTLTWVEHSVLSDFLDLIGETPAFRKEVIHAIARATRSMGEIAIAHDDRNLEELVIRFFNTYLRAAMNQRAAPFAYSIFNEYRSFAVNARESRPELLLRVAEHLLAYGRSFDSAGMPFIIGTAAEDVAAMAVSSIESDPDRSMLLASMVSRNLQQMVSVAQPIALSGVLKAAVKLALWSLASEHEGIAGILIEGIRQVPESFVADALTRMEGTREGVFWEVSDRVVAFDWVEEDLRELIPTLRSRLEARATALSGPVRKPRPHPEAGHPA